MQKDQIPSGINNKSESTCCTAVFSIRDSLFWQKRAFLFGKGRETNKLQCYFLLPPSSGLKDGDMMYI